MHTRITQLMQIVPQLISVYLTEESKIHVCGMWREICSWCEFCLINIKPEVHEQRGEMHKTVVQSISIANCHVLLPRSSVKHNCLWWLLLNQNFLHTPYVSSLEKYTQLFTSLLELTRIFPLRQKRTTEGIMNVDSTQYDNKLQSKHTEKWKELSFFPISFFQLQGSYTHLKLQLQHILIGWDFPNCYSLCNWNVNI